MTDASTQPAVSVDSHDEITNLSDNPTFVSVVDASLSRRSVLLGTAATALFTSLGGVSTLAISGEAEAATTAKKLLSFKPVAKSLADAVIVPEGYDVQVIYALGDPLTANTPDYKNDGTDGDFDNRAGDHHDGMEYFGLSADGKPSTKSGTRGVLGINHEATTDEKLSSHFIHADGGTRSLPRPAAEVDKELAIHGVSMVEVRKAASGKWEYVKNSGFNRRFTTLTEIDIAGPARGNALLKTKYSPEGTKTRGTLNNCGAGRSPWGTYMTGEENFNGYFARPKGDDEARGKDKTVTALNRYGRREGDASRHGWESAGSGDKYARWINAKTGTSADGSDDYRNEMNGQGYVVEMDPYDGKKLAKKRTALGRYAHESAAFSNPAVGQPLAVYMGDDARNEYIYKFVTDAIWSAADATNPDRLAVGDKFLDKGTLYVAKFTADGTGEWLELSLNNPAVKNYDKYSFADLADVVVNARIAGDAVGATKMDRPEWCAVNPANGEVYFTLTNNANRTIEPKNAPQLEPDASNPRAYTDVKGTSRLQTGNSHGHIIRLREAGGAGAKAFSWDIYLFGAEASADPATVNLSKLNANQDLSSPDGLAFSQATGICWIQTDDGAYTDVTNCMMLAALPGKVGDGQKVNLNYTKADGAKVSITTPVGKAPSEGELKRFLVGPKGCELTGITETPDGKALFVNIQHPGESTKAADVNDPAKYESQWPANAGYGAGKRPRSATIVITKKDGGVIGA
jgi:secreted PhoX family phosphatase